MSSILIDIKNVFKEYNGSQVLKNVNLTVYSDDKIGLIGNNGCGKSTLLRLISNDEFADKGDINVGCEFGFLTQSLLATTLKDSDDSTLYGEVKSVFQKLLDVKQEMEKLEIDLTNPEKYAELSSFFEHNDGYNIDVKIKTVLNGLGFAENIYTRPVSSFSGGEQTRIAIAKLLLKSPELLILDEPTNHLDFKTIAWLEDYLKTYRGALIIVSHDRYFLDRLCTNICEIENCELTRYKGNYSAFTRQKEELINRKIKEYDEQQEQIAKMQDYVQRNITRASTSKSAKSRVKALERMEIIEKPVTYHKPPKIEFTFTVIPPTEILSVQNIDISVGEKTLIKNVNFDVRRGEKVAIIGENGTGKSTLLKIFLKKLPLTEGRIKWADNVKCSYFEQENTILNLENTALDEIHSKFPLLNDVEIRSLLGKVRITGENVFKKIGVLSGGECAKIKFAVMLLEHANFLLLDEPTNHLDLTTKEIIENALVDFPGTVIFVSHDRYLINKVATKIIELTDTAKGYEGNFDDYLKQQSIISTPTVTENNQNVTKSLPKNKEQRVTNANKRNEKRILEKRIEELETSLKILEEEILKPDIYNDYKLVNEKYKLIEECKIELDLNIEKLIELEI